MPPSSAATPPFPVWGQAPDLDEVGRRLDRRVQVVVGKGGVGRTLVASALAKRAADAGRKTLLLEVDAPDSAARQLRVKPAVDDPREVLNNLWLCRMTPSGALREYALLTLRFNTLYKLVFENRFVKYFLSSIPSLGEFTMLGKAWFHSTEVDGQGEPRFERIIIDAPATGHAITFLSLARLVADIAPPGVMADASTKMAELVEDPEGTCFHVVTLPEDMPVNEALELCEAGQSRLHMAPGIGVVNRSMLPLLTKKEAAWVQQSRSASPILTPALDAAMRRKGREDRQQKHIARFAANSGLPWLTIAEQPADKVGHHFVDEVGRAFDAFAAGNIELFHSEETP